MKIKGTCKRDDREFLIEQVIEGGGECPWDGEPFNPDYAVVLVDALRDAAEAGSKLEHALGAVADMHPDFTLDADSVIGPLKVQLARFERALLTQP